MTGCLALKPPVEETSSAQMPSVEKAYIGNCPNCPEEMAFVEDESPNISPVPTVFMLRTGKKKGLFTSDVYILFG